MKKAKASWRARKPKRKPRSADEYIACIPEPALKRWKELRAAVQSAVPADAVEVISYGMPAFRRKRILVWYAAFADHCSLFPTAEVVALFKDELKPFATSKGTVQFPLDRRIPATLVKKLVKARVAAESK